VSELEVTDSPVEAGSPISDHAFMLPVRVTISAGVSDTPLKELQNDSFTAITPAQIEKLREISPNGFIYDSRSRQAWQKLIALQQSAEPFVIVTGLKLYRNMVVKKLSVSQDKDSSNSLIFTAECREVIIASTEIAKYPERKLGPTARQAGPVRDKGEQQGTEVKPGSLSAKLLDFIRSHQTK